jgi:hypothetical protein
MGMGMGGMDPRYAGIISETGSMAGTATGTATPAVIGPNGEVLYGSSAASTIATDDPLTVQRLQDEAQVRIEG